MAMAGQPSCARLRKRCGKKTRVAANSAGRDPQTRQLTKSTSNARHRRQNRRLPEVSSFAGRAAQQGTSTEQIRQETVAAEGIRRLGEPEDIAELVAFLCSPAARHIHGTGISIDGRCIPWQYSIQPF